MPKSKSTKKTNGTRKEDKLRPYRVDYFDVAEMQKDRVLVRSKVVRAVDANIAKLTAMETLNADGSVNLSIPIPHRYIIRAYRFYKKLSAEPIKKTYLPLDKLVSSKRAIEIMTDIEDIKKKPIIIIRPEDLMPATVVTTVIDPTTLPPDHPDHVCTDKCYDIVPLNEANEAKFFPKVGDPQPATVFVPEWGPDTDTSNVAAGQPSPLTFPDKPLVPTKDAVFDNGSELVKSHGFEICRWHGWKYIDLRDGRCAALDSGSGYLNELYGPKFYPAKAVEPLPEFDLDKAAPIVNPAPAEPRYTAADEGWVPSAPPTQNCGGEGYIPEPERSLEGFTREEPINLTIERQPTSNPRVVWYTLGAILALVYVYFHYFAR